MFDRSGLGRALGQGLEPTPQLLAPRAIVALPQGRLVVGDPPTAWLHVFTAQGRFEGRFRARDERGEVAVPMRLSVDADGALYVWTAGHAPHPDHRA